MLQNYIIVFIKKKDKQKFVYPFLSILNQFDFDFKLKFQTICMKY